MESSICVAVITGFPFMTVLWMIFFCTTGTCWSGISTPRSPRATMVPLAAAMISSRFSTPSLFSIFAMMGMSAPRSLRKFRMSRTSAAFRTKEAAM
jgi:hypothetical protein